MVGHDSLWPVLPSVLLVPLFVLGLPRRRLAGLATHILFRMLAFVFRPRIVGSCVGFSGSSPEVVSLVLESCFFLSGQLPSHTLEIV